MIETLEVLKELFAAFSIFVRAIPYQSKVSHITTLTAVCVCFRLGGLLGSGQFGTVYKGVWKSVIRGSVEVAVETLNKESKEQDKVKFLQEVAIMGQFKHPNVVEMYGVVMEGEPVSFGCSKHVLIG